MSAELGEESHELAHVKLIKNGRNLLEGGMAGKTLKVRYSPSILNNTTSYGTNGTRMMKYEGKMCKFQDVDIADNDVLMYVYKKPSATVRPTLPGNDWLVIGLGLP